MLAARWRALPLSCSSSSTLASLLRPPPSSPFAVSPAEFPKAQHLVRTLRHRQSPAGIEDEIPVASRLGTKLPPLLHERSGLAPRALAPIHAKLCSATVTVLCRGLHPDRLADGRLGEPSLPGR